MSEATEALAQAITAETPVPTTPRVKVPGDNVIEALNEFNKLMLTERTPAGTAQWLIDEAIKLRVFIAAGHDIKYRLLDTLLAVAAVAQASDIDLASLIDQGARGAYGLGVAITFVE
jgi:hypothetical protein